MKRTALAVALASLVAMPSCSGLLELDGYADATAELCDLFRTCYQFDCSAQVGKALGDADAGERSTWLASVSDQGCLEQCSSARRCLNIDPVCLAEGAACTRTEQCCGFLNGSAECGAPTGGATVCCRAKGATCAKDEDCCNADCERATSTCGGTVCASVGALCKNDFDCCSQKCGSDNHCAPNLCSQEGFSCSKPEECCVGLSCSAGVCSKGQVCRADGEACGEPGAPPCCDARPCLVVDGQGLCRDCLKANEPCDPTASKCCGDLYCDPYKKLCGSRCVTQGVGCQDDFECCSGKCDSGACTCSTGFCVDSADCCAGQCIGGSCQLDCKVGDTCHSPCIAGVAMKATCSPCVAQVCKDDPFCCCQGWDDVCVAEAFKSCTNACN